jgi:putative hydrolase of the HAD superfamily
MERPDVMNIRALILDYGEVLCQPPTSEEMRRMAAIFNVGPDLFRQLWERNRGPYDRGDLPSRTYWTMLADDASMKVSPDQLEQLARWDVEMWAHPNPAMVEWLRQSHASGIKTAILSNMHPDMIRYARKNFAWLNYFDHQTFSAEVRLIKPDPAIYEHSLRGLGVAASETLFVDDREPNIQAAQSLGIRAIQFRSVAQFRKDLAKLSFPILPIDGSLSSSASEASILS